MIGKGQIMMHLRGLNIIPFKIVCGECNYKSEEFDFNSENEECYCESCKIHLQELTEEIKRIKYDREYAWNAGRRTIINFDKKGE